MPQPKAEPISMGYRVLLVACLAGVGWVLLISTDGRVIVGGVAVLVLIMSILDWWCFSSSINRGCPLDVRWSGESALGDS